MQSCAKSGEELWDNVNSQFGANVQTTNKNKLSNWIAEFGGNWFQIRCEIVYI